MPRPVRRLSFVAPAAMLVSLFFVSCILDLSGPGTKTGDFALAPALPAGAATVVDVADVRIILRRTSDSSVALDTTVSLTPGDSVVDLSLTVIVTEPNETFWLEIECRDEAGSVVFSAGPLQVTATTSGEVEPQDVAVEYVGVGSNAAAVEILDYEVFIEFGETLTLQAQALDSSGTVIEGTPIKWISHDTDRVIVRDAGVAQIRGGSVRGWAHVVAQLLTGPADTIDVFVEPVPSSITVVSGDGQTAVVGMELSVPLVVQVDAVDGPMGSAGVDFTTADGGSFGQASVITDASGQASTTWTLGPTPGQQTATATVRDYPGLQATFTATATAASGTIYWQNPVAGNWSDPSNWSTGRIPADTDVVVIETDGTYTVTLDVTSQIDGLVVGGALGAQTLLIADTLVLSGQGTVGQNGVLELNGGAYNGGGLLSVSGQLRWEGVSGVINSTFGAGTTRIEPTGAFSLGGNINRFSGGHTIENFGSTSWTGMTRVDASEGATFINRAGGTFEALGTGSLVLIAGGAEPRFINEGSFIRAGETTATIGVPFDNDGVVDVQSGTLALTAGGVATGSFVSHAHLSFGKPGGPAYTLAASSSVAGDGLVGFSGGTALHVVNGTYAVDGLTFINDTRVGFSSIDNSRTRVLLLRGDIEGTGTLVVTDTLTWDRGTMTGAGSVEVASGGTMIIRPGNGAKAILGGRVVRNYGAATWTGEEITIGDGSVFRNEAGGTFDAQADFGLVSGAGGGTFMNAGTFTRSGPSSPPFDIAFENSGTIDIPEGTLDLNDNFTHASGAVLRGAATLDLSNATVLSFEGNVTPGPDSVAATLNITRSSLTFGSNTDFIVDIGGLTSGTEHDQLIVSGDLALNGDLQINLINSFAPNPGDMFTVITASGTVSGSFTTTPLNWVAIVSSTEVVLEYTGP